MQTNTWKKRCTGTGACVEIAAIGGDRIAIRASAFPDWPWVVLTRPELRSLFDAIKARAVVHTP